MVHAFISIFMIMSPPMMIFLSSGLGNVILYYWWTNGLLLMMVYVLFEEKKNKKICLLYIGDKTKISDSDIELNGVSCLEYHSFARLLRLSRLRLWYCITYVQIFMYLNTICNIAYLFLETNRFHAFRM